MPINSPITTRDEMLATVALLGVLTTLKKRNYHLLYTWHLD